MSMPPFRVLVLRTGSHFTWQLFSTLAQSGVSISFNRSLGVSASFLFPSLPLPSLLPPCFFNVCFSAPQWRSIALLDRPPPLARVQVCVFFHSLFCPVLFFFKLWSAALKRAIHVPYWCLLLFLHMRVSHRELKSIDLFLNPSYLSTKQ